MCACPLAGDLVGAVVETAPDVTVVVDENGRIVFVNARVASDFGFEAAALIGQPVEVLIPERFRDAHRRHRESFLAEGRARPMGTGTRELWGLRRDGTEFPIEVSLNLVRTAHGVFVAAAIRNLSERKRAAEVNFHALLDRAPDGVVLTDLDGRYVEANAAVCGMLGYSRNELVGMRVFDLILPEDEPRLARELEVLVADPSRTKTSEWSMRRKDGTLLPVEVSSTIRPDGCGYLAFFRDISARKRAAEALRRSEETLNRAQHVARLGSWDWDLRTNAVTRSAESFALCGVEPSPEYADPESLSHFIHPDDRERVMCAVRRVAREGGSFAVEHRIVCLDGTERVVLAQGSATSSNGDITGVDGTVLDITERKRAEREREESLRWMQAVLEQSPVGLILVHGPPDCRLEPNRKAQQMVGSRFERIDQYRSMLSTPDGRPLEYDQMASVRALRGEQIVEAEYILRNTSGGSMRVLVSASPIVGSDGAVFGAVLALQDISASRELERLRAEWSSVVAHELRQPLGVIAISAQELVRAAVAPTLAKPIARIRSAASRLHRMVGDLMDLSRLDASRLELARRRTDVPALVRAAVERMALEAPGRSFDVRVQADLPDADADPDRITQVIENLLTNTVKYGTSGSPIVVSVAADTDHDEITVSVSNEGRPLEPAELSRLFERFQRAAAAKTERIQGVGLGLYIARSLVEAHGGRITAASTPAGVTTFCFTLPATQGDP